MKESEFSLGQVKKELEEDRIVEFNLRDEKYDSFPVMNYTFIVEQRIKKIIRHNPRTGKIDEVKL